MRAARSWSMASAACASPRAATPPTMPVGIAVPSTAAAHARRTVDGPSCSRRSIRPLPLTAEARSRSWGMFSWCGFSPRSRPFMASSTTSKGFPPVIAQHSRQNTSSALSPRASRTMRATALVVSGASSCGRVPWRPIRARSEPASAGISSGRQATMISMASSSARAAKAVSQVRDSASAQCASSTTRTTGALRTAKCVTTQSRPSRTPCGSGPVGPFGAAVSPRAGATMLYQLPRASRRSSSSMAARAGWMSWRITWNGTCRSCSPPRANRTVQERSPACRRASFSRVVLPMPADPAKVSTPPSRVAGPLAEMPQRTSTARWIARTSDSRSSRGCESQPLGSVTCDICAPSSACGRVYGPEGELMLFQHTIAASHHPYVKAAVPSAPRESWGAHWAAGCPRGVRAR
ncbi:hypothetical protein SAVIM338S_00690 [Streptomyces avidinii]